MTDRAPDEGRPASPAPTPAPTPADRQAWGRRRLLQTVAVALGGTGVGWVSSTAARAADPDKTVGASAGGGDAAEITVLSPSAGGETVPFHGPHQAGVSTPPQAHLSLVGLDLRESVDTDALIRLCRLLSDDAARLTRGEPALADTEPELASQPSRLTITFGWGPEVVARLVPTGRAPTFDPLPSFSTDRLRDEWGQTDLVVQICGDDKTTVAHARRMLLKDSRSFATVRWIQDGFRRARGSEPDGTTMRNVMGQVDGTVNPREADTSYAGLVWGSGPEAFAGGTFMVVRRIRARMDAWDRVDRTGREFAVGRTLDTGAPLTGTDEFDEPDFEAKDVAGFPVIDSASHIRRARSEDPAERFLRRGYNYTLLERDGAEDSGLVFVAFAADLARQFVPVQQRLADRDRLNEWVTTIGSAVYLVPPGAAEGSAVGEALLGGAP